MATRYMLCILCSINMSEDTDIYKYECQEENEGGELSNCRGELYVYSQPQNYWHLQ